MNNETSAQKANSEHSSDINCSLLKLELKAAKNSKTGSFIYR